MKKLSHILRQYPLFILLLPAFFVLHGFRENYGVVPVPVAWLLFGTYLLVTLFLTGLAWIGYRDFLKAGLFASIMMAFHFFYGAIHDLLRDWFPGSLITRYTFILPATLILFIVLFIYIKRRKSRFTRTTYFINILLLLLILLDTVWLGRQVVRRQPDTTDVTASALQPCTDCRKMDVYLVITDGYPGHTELWNILNYDNSRFYKSLTELGFHIIDSTLSNYNFTTYSMASMLNMEYLNSIEGRNSNKSDLAYCYSRFKQSRVVKNFTELGYTFYNHSIFDFDNNPSSAIPTFLPRKAEAITAQTFTARMEKEIAYHLATTFKVGFVLDYFKTRDLKNNQSLAQKTRETLALKTGKPKFVYTHLVMPHLPYYFDSTGKPLPVDTLTESFGKNIPAFLNYLEYTNRELLRLVRDIRNNSPEPPVIILMSDHGFREYSGPVNNIYQFYNLNAVCLPDSNYSKFYKGMTNVNQFRVIFNTTFGQQMPLLKDSTSYLID